MGKDPKRTKEDFWHRDLGSALAEADDVIEMEERERERDLQFEAEAIDFEKFPI